MTRLPQAKRHTGTTTAAGRVGFFGLLGVGNFGNEGSLEAGLTRHQFNVRGLQQCRADDSEVVGSNPPPEEGGAALLKLSDLRDFDRIRWEVVAHVRRPLANWGKAHELRFKYTSRQAVFTDVYSSVGWGSQESGSGTGSELRATENIREWLPGVLSRLGAGSLLDAPCGDWNWMQHVDLSGIDDYYGVDIVRPVIDKNASKFGGPHRHFAVADVTCDALPKAQAILCRDTIVHMSYQDAAKILANFAATGAEWLLLNTYPEVTSNRNQFTGKRWRRLNLRLKPFSFPEPVEMVPDGGDVDPNQLAVWRLPDLPPIQPA